MFLFLSLHPLPYPFLLSCLFLHLLTWSSILLSCPCVLRLIFVFISKYSHTTSVSKTLGPGFSFLGEVLAIQLDISSLHLFSRDLLTEQGQKPPLSAYYIVLKNDSIINFAKLWSESLNNLPTTSQCENLKLETKSARVLKCSVFFFKKDLWDFTWFKQWFYSTKTTLPQQDFRGHNFASWELVLSITQRSSGSCGCLQLVLLIKCSESCVRGPETLIQILKTRIMAAYLSIHWAKGPSCLPRVASHWLCKMEGQRSYAIFHPLILKMGKLGFRIVWSLLGPHNQWKWSKPPYFLFQVSLAFI